MCVCVEEGSDTVRPALCGVSLRPLFSYSVMFRSVGQVLCGDAPDQRIRCGHKSGRQCVNRPNTKHISSAA